MNTITIDRAAVQQALEALDEADTFHRNLPDQRARRLAAMAALRAALAQQAEPVQEPVAYIHRQGNHWEVSERFLLDDEKARGWTEEPLYLAPPQRKPLTEEVATLTAQHDALLEALREAQACFITQDITRQEYERLYPDAEEETK